MPMAAVRTASPPGQVSFCPGLRQRAGTRRGCRQLACRLLSAITRLARIPAMPSCRREMLFFRYRLLLLLLLLTPRRIWYPGVIRDPVTPTGHGPSDRAAPDVCGTTMTRVNTERCIKADC